MSADVTRESGIPYLDERIGGFQTGDNVILEVDIGTPPQSWLRAFLSAALARGDRCVYASFDRSPATIVNGLQGLPKGEFIVLDAFTEGKGRGERVFRDFYEAKRDPTVRVERVDYPHRPAAFHEDLDAAVGAGRGTFIVVDSLTGMQELWGDERRVRAFYTHTCPRLFDTHAIAVWVLNRAVHTVEFRAAIGHIGQVVLGLGSDGPRLQIIRAAGRDASRVGGSVTFHDDGKSLVIPAPRDER